MLSARSRNGVPIRLPDERWRHITERHPEMTNQREKVLDTIADPDLIQEGEAGELLAIRQYPESPLTSKHLVVPFREVSPEDGFVLTAYLTSRPSTRRVTLWKR